jgi:V8-like Glu-specific endopeptidase
VEQPSLGVEREAIIGGATDTGDPEIFELRIVDSSNPNNWWGCSATLIASHTLLTAAHCVDPSYLAAPSWYFVAVNATTDTSVTSSQWLSITKTQFDPAWNHNAPGSHDVGLALLATQPTGLTPKGWNASSVDSLVGAPLRAVGYGNTALTDTATGFGTKRQVALTVGKVDAHAVYYGESTQGIAHGDSGGPTLHTYPDGVERIIGVVSNAIIPCVTGVGCAFSQRTDDYKAFILGWLQQNEQPTCSEDHLCASGCATPDVDCVCVADGVCGGACPNPSVDPDCAACAQDGVCNKLACPTPDPDCVPMGDSCTRAADCASRVCVGDAAHGPFCSANCTTDADCGGGLSCDPASSFCYHKPILIPSCGCDSSTVCSGPSADSVQCNTPCTSDSDCYQSGATCVTSYDGVTQYCSDPTSATSDRQDLVGGCASALDLFPLAALALLRRRRR